MSVAQALLNIPIVPPSSVLCDWDTSAVQDDGCHSDYGAPVYFAGLSSALSDDNGARHAAQAAQAHDFFQRPVSAHERDSSWHRERMCWRTYASQFNDRRFKAMEEVLAEVEARLADAMVARDRSATDLATLRNEQKAASRQTGLKRPKLSRSRRRLGNCRP